jgi:hypothetical protein
VCLANSRRLGYILCMGNKENKADVKATDAKIEAAIRGEKGDDFLDALRDSVKGDMPAIITPHGVLPAEKDDR